VSLTTTNILNQVITRARGCLKYICRHEAFADVQFGAAFIQGAPFGAGGNSNSSYGDGTCLIKS
jgi:hypothetical protein